ncbi:unnamed protein product, partial [Brenthis ino]
MEARRLRDLSEKNLAIFYLGKEKDTRLKAYKSQYPLVDLSTPKACENPKDTTRVEQFFNLIFTEFHNQPPICVCVQMCLEQATYCYPNGCLRRPDRKIEGTTAKPVNRIQYETTKSSMFLVDKDQDFDDIFEVTNRKINAEKELTIQMNEVLHTPNPFKELVLKYKKLPKLEMRYNLREQVKNSKASKSKRDRLDVSKTRWPMNRHFLHGKKLFNSLYKNNNRIKQTKFFISMSPEVESVIDVPVYKSFINKREDTGANMEALYLYKTDIANFSLETLIDNLILSTIDKNKVIKTFDETTTSTQDMQMTDSLILNDANTNHDSTDINVKMSFTKEDIANNYLNVLNITNKPNYAEMITTLSKEIDKQNNITIEMVKGFIEEENLYVLINSTVVDGVLGYNQTFKDGYSNLTEANAQTADSKKNNDNFTLSTKRFTVPILRTSLRKPNRKRIVRKLL